MKQQGITPNLPDCDAPYFLDYFFSIGPGSEPVSFQEIESWQRLSGIELDTWQAKTLRRLSIDYASQYEKSKNRSCQPPDEDELTELQLKELATKKFRNAMANRFTKGQ